MTHLLYVVLAVFAVWETVLAVLPIWLRTDFSYLFPVAVAGIAVGLTFVPSERVLLALAATGGLGILHAVTRAGEGPEPPDWHLPEVHLPKMKKPVRKRSGANRLPTLP